MSDNTVILEVNDLHKSYGDHEVLKGISTTIKKGDVLALIGPSGCGKSTFLRSLNLLEVPTSGHVLFEGTDMTDASVDINHVREKIGMVFQQFNLFPNMTIRENIMLAPVKLGSCEKGGRPLSTHRTRRQSRCLPGAAFRWTETAYCHRAFPCHEPGHHFIR